MKNLKGMFLLAVLGLFIKCAEHQARRPISQQSGSFMKESIERNKKLNKSEEAILDSVMKSKPNIQYINSQKGYWYCYENKSVTADTIRPKRGDIVHFDYNINDVKGNVIYSEVELKPQNYIVDKENIMTGLRSGIKLMKKNETVTFLFPSNIAFGYFGDKNKIGANEPILCTVTLNDIKAQKYVSKKSVPKTTDLPAVETTIKDNKENPEQQIKAE